MMSSDDLWANAETTARDRKIDAIVSSLPSLQADLASLRSERDRALAEVERLGQQNASERQHVDWLVEKEEIAARFKVESERVIAEVGELVDPWMGFDGAIVDGVKAVVAEVERLRAAQPALPDVGHVTRDEDGTIQVDGYDFVDCDLPHDSGLIRAAAARTLAVAAFLDAEAAAADTTPDKKCLCDYPAGAAYGAEPSSVYWCPQHGPDEDEDTAPDTSRVTFGARHEGTGMVLLRHADLGHSSWGLHELHTADWHRQMVHHRNIAHPAHAALAEVREALNTAERTGVSVWRSGDVTCEDSGVLPDDAEEEADYRACRFLAREVQAFVDQGLRGDDLSARVPYEVRDHRTPVEADTTPDGYCSCYGPGDCSQSCGFMSHREWKPGQQWPGSNPVPVEADTTPDDEVEFVAGVIRRSKDMTWQVQALNVVEALDAHRAARTSQEAGQ